jgi:NAD(P)-dependent dehydrogenase (short-subunit alcohol dehydrogenase family)
MTTFGKNSTTDEVLAGIDLAGKTVLVTGGSTGLGAETARALAARGALVTIVARSAEKLARVATSIKGEADQEVETASLELDKPSTVRAFADGWLAHHDTLDILVNNAGIGSPPLTRTVEGWEIQFAANHLGHFLLTNLLAAPLQAARQARVVNLSSGGHAFAPVNFDDPNYQSRTYNALESYGQSKTANIWFTTELARRCAHQGVSSFAVHPGVIKTELTRDMAEEAWEMFRVVETQHAELFKSIQQGAATSCWAATSPELDGKTGLYLEDCHVAKPAGENPLTGGYAPYAYDTESAQKLWDLSNELLGTDF